VGLVAGAGLVGAGGRRRHHRPDRRAKGRLQAAIALLDRGKGERLLISGVHADTTRADLFDAAGSAPRRAACCVDLGAAPRTRSGNAGEAAQWIATHAVSGASS
jgi:hypothetical protein